MAKKWVFLPSFVPENCETLRPSSAEGSSLVGGCSGIWEVLRVLMVFCGCQRNPQSSCKSEQPQSFSLPPRGQAAPVQVPPVPFGHMKGYSSAQNSTNVKGIQRNLKRRIWFITSCPQPSKTTRVIQESLWHILFTCPLVVSTLVTTCDHPCGKAIPREGAGEFKDVTHIPRLCIFWDWFHIGSRQCPTHQAVFLPPPPHLNQL